MRWGGLARLIAPFRRLHWRMTFSYTVVTVSALVVLEFLIIAGGLFAIDRFFHSPLMARTVDEAYSPTLTRTLRPELRKRSPNLAALQSTLDLYGEEPPINAQDNGVLPSTDPGMEDELFVVNSEGLVLATSGSRFVAARQKPYTSLPVEALHPLVEAALDEAPLAQRYTFVDDRILLASPIVEEESGEILGAVGYTSPLPSVDWRLVRALLPVVGFSLAFFTLGVGAIGTLFGFLTSRPLVRRLAQLSTVAGDWSQGDFTSFVRDEGGDEIAALGRRMNRMAEQLQNLLEERNRLAVVEERNRIARDLHDSAKQQAFAAAGQIGAAQALLARDPAAAAEHLREAEELLSSLRQELSLLIEELRPAALEEKGLGAALQEYVERWSRRSGITGVVELRGNALLSLEMEQALFRIAQEALANVARHSEARRVRLALLYGGGGVKLQVVDDGTGFEPQRVTAGFGLNSIRQRAASLPGGTFSLESGPGAGTTIEVRAELDDPEREEA